ncbi:phenazine biosynthesis protein PhzF [Curtobacterium sp. MCBD17_034]|uniref:PhzF family phenazine biosynthesis protein n=1 Tax=unclassified Curtobacterium TaxID=257496 RepID=UPI000DA9A1B6|nr:MULTISPECIES: PhzF family phenazine biosynthesis protein [unclassified Curtobacterium]PZF55361.1 phenazine biosynthesis protein PhzF [Curtobacterium sp. MCBD17_034]PZM32827.1 phenazine biosynthesis protein PhzF [Curtobacterium sp. MCBD17_031]
MSTAPRTLQFRAFTTTSDDPRSGNPAGVVLHAETLTDADMLAIAGELGHSETAFLTAVTPRSARIRYFTPRAEIAFCGHATIASGVALARDGAEGVVDLTTNAGVVPVAVHPDRATLTAVATTVAPLPDAVLGELLDALRLSSSDLDPALPPALLSGGNPHPVVTVREGVLARVDHDGDAVLRLQDREGWDGTIAVVHRVDATRFVSRHPFPRGGVREDPATGSAAAALGAYLRDGGHVAVPAVLTVEQGAETGHPSRITVEVPATGRVRVSGTVEELAGPGLRPTA